MASKYHYIEEKAYDKEMKPKEYPCLRCFSKKAMKKKYPKGGYLLVGGIGKGVKNKQGTIEIEETNYDYYAYYSKLRYGIDGYLFVGEDKYIAVIGKRDLRNMAMVVVILGCIGIIISSMVWLLPDSGIDEEAMEYTPPKNLQVETDPNHIALPGYTEIVMLANSDTAYMALWNPASNPCYFQFTITNTQTKEELYRSKLVPPGKAVSKIKFTKKIKEGVYPIEVTIDTYSLEDKETALNGGVSKAKLVARRGKK